LDLLEGGTDVPNYLLDWDTFQKEFLLKWADLNARKKARARLLAGVKQTTSVRRYTEIFDELVLEAGFRDPDVLVSMFYEGLKWEVRQHLVGKSPEDLDLAELKALSITLDEERMSADRRETKSTTTRSHTTDSSETNRPPNTQSRAEVARVGASLSADDRARYMREGRCFGCGKTGHRRPDCPDGKPRAHVAALEPVVESSAPETQPKN
jgi:hypothetical protein